MSALVVVGATAAALASWVAARLLARAAERRRTAAVKAVAAEPCRPGRWRP